MIQSVFVHDDARRFLLRLVPPEGQYLELRVIVPDGPAPVQYFCSTTDEAIAVVERYSGTANVYVGACPRFRRSGKKEDVRTVVSFWVDLDYHQIHSDRDEARAIALERLQSFTLPPSMIVLTGNGVQSWWILDTRIRIGGDWPLERLEGVNRGLATKLGGDSVQDLSRVLRVPGTVNLPDAKKRARGCAPVTAQLLVSDGPTHGGGSLAPIAVVAPGPSRAATCPAGPVAKSDRPDDEVLEAFEEFLKQLSPAHKLVRTWHGDRSLNDSSRSGWDMALANQLFKAGIRAEYIPQILSAFRHGRGVFATPEYVARTMAKAGAWRRSKRGSTRSA